MIPSDAIREFIRGWEKCSLTRYNDSAGKSTIGWGHLLPVGDTTQSCTQEQADAMFAADVDRIASTLDKFLVSDIPQQQYDALLSLAFNEGPNSIGNSTLMRDLNMGHPVDAEYQFARWVYVRDPTTGRLIVSDGIRKRRQAEQRIFTDGVYDSAH